MKKIDKMKNFLQDNLEIFRCPVCFSDFKKIEDDGLICESNHHFNVSKKGTVHFLNKTSGDHYDKDQLEARYHLSQNDFWTPLMQAIREEIKDLDGSLLDIGCGEGSQLSLLKDLGYQGKTFAFDISKDGINLAAKNHFGKAFWWVGDLTNIPLASKSVQTVLNILAPIQYKELKRLLIEGGQFIKIVPTENYLLEIRQNLLGENSHYSNDQVVNNFIKEFPSHSTRRVSYTHSLGQSDMSDLLAMTPLTWNVEKKKIKTYINSQSKHDISIEFDLLIGNH